MKTLFNLKGRLGAMALLGIFLFAAGALSVSAEVCRQVKFDKNFAVHIEFKADTPQCSAAKSAFDAAVVIVTGSPDYSFAVDANKISTSNPYIWVNELAKDPKYSAKFNDGLKFGDAVSFLKERIATNAADRAYAIDNAFREVYGRPSNSTEQAGWDAQVKAQKAWYTVIVTSEIGRLNADPKRRIAAIDDAYQLTMGKTATPDELNYWKSRTEHYRLIVNANRNFLYSSNGSRDLVQTVRVAYLAKYRKDPPDSELKYALTQVADKKLIFSEMMDPKVNLALSLSPKSN